MKAQPSCPRRRRLTGWALAVLGCLAGAGRLTFGGTSAPPVSLPMTLFSENFSTSEYYTNNTQLKYRLSGKQATPRGEDRYLIRQLRLEMFEEDGQRQLTIEAPECFYDFKARIANSPGPLMILVGDGRMTVSGRGFLWQQTLTSLVISNQVNTRVREMPPAKSNP